jgi:hypothetical protein
MSPILKHCLVRNPFPLRDPSQRVAHPRHRHRYYGHNEQQRSETEAEHGRPREVSDYGHRRVRKFCTVTPTQTTANPIVNMPPANSVNERLASNCAAPATSPQADSRSQSHGPNGSWLR